MQIETSVADNSTPVVFEEPVEEKPVVSTSMPSSKSQILKDIEQMKSTEEVDLEETSHHKEDPKIKAFTVSNPIKVAGHIKYKVTGIDSEGPFEESRRFREFFALRNALASRWPGIYIPAIPEKKLVGNQDDKFVEERRGMLERFMKEIAKFDYLT